MSTHTIGPASVARVVLDQYQSQPWRWQRDDVLDALRFLNQTQRELARRMKVTESQLSDWLRGRDGREPSFETRVRMDAALAELIEDAIALA